MFENSRPPKPRIWIDATRDDYPSTKPLDVRPPVPPIPDSIPLPPLPLSARHSYIPVRSLSGSAASADPQRRSLSANVGRSKKKERHGFEVISNLIDSIDTISNHSRAGSSRLSSSAALSTPASPTLRPKLMHHSASEAGDRTSGNPHEFSALRNSIRRELSDYDDAAEPPVVRTSKRPSGFSEWTAQRSKRETPHNIKSYLKTNMSSKSSSSLASNGRDDDTKSMGDPVGDQPVRRASVQSFLSQRRTSFDSRSSLRNGTAPLISRRTSGDKIKTTSSDWGRESLVTPTSIKDFSYSPRPGSQPASPTPKKPHPFDAPTIDFAIPPSLSGLYTAPDRDASRKKGKMPMMEPLLFPSNSTPAFGPSVPSRRSSLKVYESAAPVNHRPQSREGYPQYPRSEIVPEADESSSPMRSQTHAQAQAQAKQLLEPTKSSPTRSSLPAMASRKSAMAKSIGIKSGLATSAPKATKRASHPNLGTTGDMLDGEDTQVTRRIKELKARKEEREKLAQRPSVNGLRSPNIASPNSSNLSPNSDAGSFATGPKANGVSPLLEPAYITSSRSPKFGGAAIDLGLADGFQNKSSGRKNGIADYLAVDDEPDTPLTPTLLPINYQYVLKRLGQESPVPSHNESVDSSVRSATTPRPKSMGATIRSSNPRKDLTKSLHIEQAAPKSTESSFLPRFIRRKERPAFLDSEPEPVRTPSVLRRSNSSKKKRWSQPDMPAGDRKSSIMDRESKYLPGFLDKSDKSEAAAEETRRSSTDSMDKAVSTFINAPRLSRKIRHPQTNRVISFSEVGDPTGSAVFCCVGMGLTRYVMAFYDELALTLKLRLITPDRPGVGESPSDQFGTPLSWPGAYLRVCSVRLIATNLFFQTMSKPYARLSASTSFPSWRTAPAQSMRSQPRSGCRSRFAARFTSSRPGFRRPKWRLRVPRAPTHRRRLPYLGRSASCGSYPRRS